MTNKYAQQQDMLIKQFLTYCQRKIYRAKQLIIKAGEPSKDLYFIVSGSVTVMIEDHKGREIVLAYLNSGDFFGEMGLFEDKHLGRTAFIRTKTKSEIAKISYEKFKTLHSIFPDILFYIAAQMAIRLRRTSDKAMDLAFTDVKGRIAKTLFDLCMEPDAMTHPDGMQISITRKELGRIVGCSREMAGRVLKSLEEDRLISVYGKTMIIFGTR